MDKDTVRAAGALGLEGSLVHIEGLPLQKIELRKLRHAAVLAVEGNFARAAKKLHITQSALSQSIARLEEDVGLVLFDRDPTGVTLSRVGRQIIGRIDKLLFDARGLAHDLVLARTADSGEVVFGTRPDVARLFLGDLLRQVFRETPRLQVKAGVSINEILLEYLSHEGFEFVICDEAVDGHVERLSVRRIGRFSMDFYVRPNHPLATREALSVRQLRDFPIASAHLTGKNYSSVRAWLGLEDTDPFPGTVWCDDYGHLMEVVTYADAVLLAPSEGMAREMAAGLVQKIRPADVPAPLARDLFLITLAGRSLSPAASLILDRVEALIDAKVPA
jgi:DNA-binding transcriptional LysR family regulator